MKKIILCLILCGSLTFAQTATTPTDIAPPQTVAPKVDTALEGVAKNIDRRLVYFNRYKQSEDMESLAKLVSGENKDFYVNFMRYVKTAPVFTLKRDMKERIIKNPVDEYVIPAIISLDGKEKKVSLTFIEEKMEQGSKWLIYNSNLHIGSIPPKAETNLASSVIKDNKTTPATTPQKQTNDTPAATETIETKPVANLPVIKKTEPTAKPAVIEKTPLSNGSMGFDFAGLDIMTLILIALSIVVVIGGGVGYYLTTKKRKAKILAATTLAAAAASASTTATLSETSPSLETNASNIGTPPAPSNVTISTVEEIQNTSSLESDSSPEVASEEPSQEIHSESSENENVAVYNSGGESTLVSLEKDTSQLPTMSSYRERQEGLSKTDTPVVSLEESMGIPLEPEATVIIEPIAPEPVPAEMAVSNLFTSPAPEPEDTSVSENTAIPTIVDVPVENTQPHAIFESIFDPVSTEETTQKPISSAS